MDEFGLELYSYTQDGDYQIKTAKGTLQLFKEWLQIIKPEKVKEIHGVLNEVRATRSIFWGQITTSVLNKHKSDRGSKKGEQFSKKERNPLKISRFQIHSAEREALQPVVS